MKIALYNAAVVGECEKLEGFKAELESQETLEKNTVLHVAVKVAAARKAPYENGGKLGPIRKICELCPSLIRRANLKGDTPLHIAARGGRSDVVKLLVKETKSVDEVVSLVTMVNSKKDTALHEALRNHHLFDRKYQPEYLDVVKTLIYKNEELPNLINDDGESPVFIAAREGLYDFLEELLSCSSEYGGPCKTTALHVAVLLREEGEKIAKDGILPAKTGETKKTVLDIIGKLMEAKPDLIKEEDESKRTPLHYAANLPSHKKVKDSHEKVKKLLDLTAGPDDDHKYSVVYHPDKNGMTALHYAAHTGATKSIDELFERCSVCFEQVDNKGWTTLHFAVAGGSSDDSTIKYIIKNKNEKLRSISMAMVNDRDKNGDTPLHLAARIPNYDALSFLMDLPEVNKRARNNDNLTALDILKATGTESMDDLGLEKKSLANNLKKKTGAISSEAPKVAAKEDTQQDGELQKVGSQRMEDLDNERQVAGDNSEKGNLRDIELLVATLIATVTFAASFTMPGGYNNEGPDEGMANLSSEPAFQIFLVANTGAMALSTAAIFTHLNAVMSTFDRSKSSKADRSFNKANLFTVIAIIGMVIAFVAGTYLVLANNKPLAIWSTVIGCCLFFGPVGPRLLVSLVKYCYHYLVHVFEQLFNLFVCQLVCCCCCILFWCKKDDNSGNKEGEEENKHLQSSAQV
ncbi:hypothetical protein NE237_027510 [Protea cynaroides]|uniref:PGG domain-containing protein n=1 Tax=Protea cynaroides TaxID=273540 RepID=A0A9Q0GQA1_9MAGN|nr:hypothetical protein NE237_027510 [Protea cynaroides]